MGLRARISLFVFCAVTLLTGGILFGVSQDNRFTQDNLASLTLANQHTVWEMATARLVDRLLARAVAVPQDELAEALNREDFGAVMSRVVREQRDGVRAVLLDEQGRIVGSEGAAEETGSVLDAGVLAGVLTSGVTTSDLNRDIDGALVASVALPIRPLGISHHIQAVLVLSQPVAPILADAGKAADSQLFLLGLHGEALGGGSLPAGLDAAVQPVHFGVSVTNLGERVLRVGVIPLLSQSGARLGWELSVADITLPYQRTALLRGFGLVAIVLFALAIQSSLYFYLNRAFRPLERSMAALKALAEGDTTVEISGEGSGGEVGRLASAVRIVRDLKREEARNGSRAKRQRRRQELFIRRQMLGLAETLEEPARTALLADLERIEEDASSERGAADALGAMAIAFRYMAERVKQQHADLAHLVSELREALAVKTEMMGLQQQVAIAARIQASILPKPLPPRPEMEICGALLPAQEMDGDFYDFFPRADGRMVIAVGQIGGSGLAKAFMMLAVRTMLKAMMLGGQEPADTLARMDVMLKAENELALAVRLFVALFDPTNGRLSFANAGYETPLLVRRPGEVIEVRMAASEALALGGAHCTATGILDIPLRATLLLVSHGASKVADRFGRVLGRDGVIAALQNSDDLSPFALCDVVQAAILGFAPSGTIDDP
jgi:sigma-B regulation protein RsbU (phosphoserine phosphatase)